MDKRARKTDLALRQALFTLLERQTIDQVSIVALCRQAQVSRRTFYVHYQRVTDILDEYQDELYWSVSRALSAGQGTSQDLVAAFDRILKANFTGFRCLCMNKRHQELVARFQHLLATILLDNLTQQPTGRERLIIEFLAAGLIQTYVYWFEHPDQLSYQDLVAVNRQLVAQNLGLVAGK